jgi:hypothetical protein
MLQQTWSLDTAWHNNRAGLYVVAVTVSVCLLIYSIIIWSRYESNMISLTLYVE